MAWLLYEGRDANRPFGRTCLDRAPARGARHPADSIEVVTKESQPSELSVAAQQPES
jgi:hypothetical protein